MGVHSTFGLGSEIREEFGRYIGNVGVTHMLVIRLPILGVVISISLFDTAQATSWLHGKN